MKPFYWKVIAGGPTGLTLGIIMTVSRQTAWPVILMPFYVIGLVFGIGTVLPWMGRFAASLTKGGFAAALFGRTVLVIICLLLLPICIAFLISLGSCIGLVKAVMELITLIRESKTERYVVLGRRGENTSIGWNDTPMLSDNTPAGPERNPFLKPKGRSDPEPENPFSAKSSRNQSSKKANVETDNDWSNPFQ